MNRSAAFVAGAMLALSASLASATPIDIPIIINGPIEPPPSPPQCSIDFNPLMPIILNNTPKGTAVATIVLANCTGAPAFGFPYFDDGGLFAISGSQIVINPQGPGVTALAGTTQNATITASP